MREGGHQEKTCKLVEVGIQGKGLCLVAKDSKELGDLEGLIGKKTPGNTENEVRCGENLGWRGRVYVNFNSLGNKC